LTNAIFVYRGNGSQNNVNQGEYSKTSNGINSLNWTDWSQQEGTASEPQLDGNGNGAPAIQPSCDGSRVIQVIGIGHPPSGRCLPGSLPSASQLPLSNLGASSSNLNLPSMSEVGPPPPYPSHPRQPVGPTLASLERKTSIETKKTESKRPSIEGEPPSTSAGGEQRRTSIGPAKPPIINRPLEGVKSSVATRRESVDVLGRKSLDKKSPTDMAWKPSIEQTSLLAPRAVGPPIGSINPTLTISPAPHASSPSISQPRQTMTARLLEKSQKQANSVPVAIPRSSSPAAPLSPSFTPTRRTRAPSFYVAAGSSPQRDMLRQAGTILVRELVHKRSSSLLSGRDVADELDTRLGGLVGAEKRGSGETEERERKHFTDAVGDGYVLCQ